MCSVPRRSAAISCTHSCSSTATTPRPESTSRGPRSTSEGYASASPRPERMPERTIGAMHATHGNGRLVVATPVRRRGPDRRSRGRARRARIRAIWIPDVGGDVLGAIEVLFGATPRIVVATGILNVWMHEPAEVAQRRASWSDGWQRRFLLGLGVSHARADRPREPRTLHQAVLQDGRATSTGSTRPRLRSRWTHACSRRCGPRMLGLARDRAAGAHPYFVPPEHIASDARDPRSRCDDRSRAGGRARP